MGGDRGPAILAVNATLLSFAVLTAFLRLYVRGWLKRQFGWDDLFMIFSLIFFIIYVAFTNQAIRWGLGRHIDSLSQEQISETIKNWFVAAPCYAAAMIAAKISIAIFILRITPPLIYTWIIYIAMTISFITNAMLLINSIIMCLPVAHFGDKSNSKQSTGHCESMMVSTRILYAYAAITVMTDFTYAFLPIFLISGLNMPTRDKLALIPIFALAAMYVLGATLPSIPMFLALLTRYIFLPSSASLAAIVRIAYTMEFLSHDLLWQAVPFTQWTTIEIGLSLIAACLATLRPLFDMLVETLGVHCGPSIPSTPSAMPEPRWNLGNLTDSV